MPTTTRYLDPPSGLTTIGSQTSLLRNKIAERKRINPADIDSIRNLYGTWRAHTHSYYDEVYVAYPNTPPRGSESHTRVGSVLVGSPTDLTPIQAGPNEYKNFAGEVFELISNFNNYVHQHYHTVQDETG